MDVPDEAIGFRDTRKTSAAFDMRGCDSETNDRGIRTVEISLDILLGVINAFVMKYRLST